MSERWGGRGVAVAAAFARCWRSSVSGCTPTGPGALVRLSDQARGRRGPPPVRSCLRCGRSRCRAVAPSTSPAAPVPTAGYKVAKGVLSVRRGHRRRGGSPATAGRQGGHLPGARGDSWNKHRPLHRRHRQQPRPQGQRLHRDHHHHRGNGHTGRSSNSIATHALLEAPTSLWANGTGGLDIGNRFGGAHLNLAASTLTATSTHSPLFAVDPAHNTYSFHASVAHPADFYPYRARPPLPGPRFRGALRRPHQRRQQRRRRRPHARCPLPQPDHRARSGPVGEPLHLLDPAHGPLPLQRHRVHRRRDAHLHTVTGFGGYDAEDALITVAPNGDLYPRWTDQLHHRAGVTTRPAR